MEIEIVRERRTEKERDRGRRRERGRKRGVNVKKILIEKEER
jgi:hypothetical protein